MESKLSLEEKAMVSNHFDVRRSNMDSRPSNSSSCSSCVSSEGLNSKLCGKATEFLCSACLLCISLPLTVAWCCIKLPCKAGCHVAQHARHWACGLEKKRVYASYSSFSDIDLDILPGKPHTCSKTLGAPRSKRVHTATQLQFKSLQQPKL